MDGRAVIICTSRDNHKTPKGSLLHSTPPSPAVVADSSMSLKAKGTLRAAPAEKGKKSLHKWQNAYSDRLGEILQSRSATTDECTKYSGNEVPSSLHKAKALAQPGSVAEAN